MYKIETHLHTGLCSSCGRLDTETILEGYAAAGYHAITVTDHFSRYNFERQPWPTDRASWDYHRYLEGYCQLKDRSKAYGLKVYRGAEVRFDGFRNDYLLYNYPLEFLEDPECFFTMGLEAFYPLCQKAGALLVQAHPFREKCIPVDVRYLDGVEVMNMHPRHDSQNHLAWEMARQDDRLICLCGSDCHQLPDIGAGGILSDTLPEDEKALAELLRSKNFRLMHDL